MLADLGRERLPSGSPFTTRLKLTRFSRPQTGELLAALLAEPASDDLRDSIYQETEGNPFFIEEVVKTLVEEGIIYRTNGRWERCDTDEVRVPQSVRLAIEGRIARLPEAVQDVLRLAAIFGRRFDFETLRQACDKSEDELIEAIESAQRVQLVEEVGGGHGGMYVLAFTHALIPAALVDGISGLRRRRMHRKAVEVIARLHPEDYESLAHHSAEAADDTLALDYYAKAAERARRLYANQDAIRLYSDALALLSEKEVDLAALKDGSLYRQRFNLLLNRSGVYDIQGQRPEQLADIQSMLAIAGPQGLDDPALHCDALISLAAYNQIIGQGQVVEPGQRALELARQLKDPARQGAAYSVLAIFEMNRYEFITGREYFRQAIESLRVAGLKAAVAHNLNWLSNLESRAARHDDARKLLEEAIVISRELGDRRLEALNLRRMAINLINLNRYAEALPLSLQAVDLHRQVGDRVSEVNAENVIALCYGDMGEMEKAEEHFMRSLAMAEEIDMVLGIYHVVFNLAENYYPIMGEYEKAIALIDENLKRPQFQEDDFMVRNLLDRKNDLLAQLGQYEAALEIARDVLRRNMEAENWEQAFSSIMRLGYILVELGRFDEARQQYDQALHIAEGIQETEKRALVIVHWGLGFWHFRQGASLGGNLLPASDPVNLQQALKHFETSLEIAQTLPSKVDDDNIDSVCFRAITQAELGDRAAALQSIQQVRDYLAVKPRPRHQFAYLAVAYVLYSTGQPGALEALRPAYERFVLVADKLHDLALRESYMKRSVESSGVEVVGEAGRGRSILASGR